MRELIKKILLRYGWKVFRPSIHEIYIYRYKHVRGIDEDDDLHRLFGRNDRIMVFDIGGNVGQSVDRYKDMFPNSIIHSFEPGVGIFDTLKTNIQKYKDTYAHNLALGSSTGVVKFHQHDIHVNSSIYPNGSDLSKENTYKEIEVQCSTLDIECEKNKIDRINILKVDTQGYDIEVLKGARNLIAADKIDIIVIEHTVNDQYKGAPSYAQQVQFLDQNNFKLVVSYRNNYSGGVVSWFDAIYKRASFKDQRAL